MICFLFLWANIMKKNFLLIVGLFVTAAIGAMAQDPNDNNNQNNGKRRLSEEFAGEKVSKINKKPRYEALAVIASGHSPLNPQMDYGFNVPNSADHPAVQVHINHVLAIPFVAANLQDAMNGAGNSESESDDVTSEDSDDSNSVTEQSLRNLQQSCQNNK